MNDNLKYKIRWNGKSLQEIDKENKQVGQDWWPCSHQFWFTASKLQYHYNINNKSLRNYIERDTVAFKFEEYTEPNAGIETITGTLYSGLYCSGGVEISDSYSTFVTNQKINSFGLKIRKAENGIDKSKCHIYDDYGDLCINFILPPQQFDEIVELIKTKCADKLTVRLQYVSGFYKEHAKYPKEIKILLLDTENPEVIKADGYEIELQRLGNVGEFDINITQSQQLFSKNVKQIFADAALTKDERKALWDTKDSWYERNKDVLKSLLFFIVLTVLFGPQNDEWFTTSAWLIFAYISFSYISAGLAKFRKIHEELQDIKYKLSHKNGDDLDE